MRGPCKLCGLFIRWIVRFNGSVCLCWDSVGGDSCDKYVYGGLFLPDRDRRLAVLLVISRNRFISVMVYLCDGVLVRGLV